MSYLDTPRLCFAGRFFSDPSTVNNHPGHYELAAFDRTKHWRPGPGGGIEHGWWNPDGAHQFDLIGVTIKSAVYEDGSVVDGAQDSLFRFSIQRRGGPPAKMVDLDPDQQLVSMIFGLEVLLRDDTGRVAFEAALAPVPFTDIWRKGPPPGGDEAAGVAYQSVLNVTRWGDVSTSRFLQQLKAASEPRLSIKFNLDGYSMNAADPARFAFGRIVGALGAARAAEPVHYVRGRHFGKDAAPVGSAFPGFVPPRGINYFVGVHDRARKKVRLDLGNALPVAPAGGPFRDIGRLLVGTRSPDGSVATIAEVPYRAAAAYETSAGIAEVPADRELTDAEMNAIKSSPLCLVVEGPGTMRIVSEEADVHLRADMFVARLNPGDSVTFRFHASRRGEPLANTQLNLFMFVPGGPDAQMNFPVGALTLPASVTTDADGNADVTALASDPGNPRFFFDQTGSRRVHVDGQLYMIGYEIDGEVQPNPSNFLSLLVWNTFVPDEPPTWEGSMRAVFAQYGNLYPIMTKSPGIDLDLADYDQVVASRDDILAVLQVPTTDARYMPVSRDLSSSRTAAMIRWLTEIGPDGLPLRGTAPAPAAPAIESKAVALAVHDAARAPEPERGSKFIAGLRRVSTRQPTR